jgi:hypothetical protein
MSLTLLTGAKAVFTFVRKLGTPGAVAMLSVWEHLVTFMRAGVIPDVSRVKRAKLLAVEAEAMLAGEQVEKARAEADRLRAEADKMRAEAERIRAEATQILATGRLSEDTGVPRASGPNATAVAPSGSQALTGSAAATQADLMTLIGVDPRLVEDLNALVSAAAAVAARQIALEESCPASHIVGGGDSEPSVGWAPLKQFPRGLVTAEEVELVRKLAAQLQDLRRLGVRLVVDPGHGLERIDSGEPTAYDLLLRAIQGSTDAGR